MTASKKGPGAVERITAGLRAKIESGKFPPGSKLPSLSEIQASEGIASQTAREVFRALERDGLAVTRQGKGSFVTPFLGKITRDGTGRYQPDARSEGGARGAFEAELNRLGLLFDRDRSTVDIDRVRPPREIAAALGLHHASNALRRHRNMWAVRDPQDPDSGFVVQIATSWFPLDLVTGTQIEQLDTGEGGSKSRLAELGHAHRTIRETIEVRFPTTDEAAALNIPEDRPVYDLLHHAMDAAGRVVEVAQHVMPVTTWRFSYTWELDAE
ncbi:GntR family transcriptional regulator [Streptomyces sp. NPDC048507]|uniref:GntR family transcriptional regulator n=1 Tax=Streptomyces sp. NPDC048507 TaxID=3365560 RepID=UPI00371F6F27